VVDLEANKIKSTYLLLRAGYVGAKKRADRRTSKQLSNHCGRRTSRPGRIWEIHEDDSLGTGRPDPSLSKRL